MAMLRWALVGLILLVAAFIGALLREEQLPQLVVVVVTMLLAVPGLLLMEANLDRRRERKRAARQ